MNIIFLGGRGGHLQFVWYILQFLWEYRSHGIILILYTQWLLRGFYDRMAWSSRPLLAVCVCIERILWLGQCDWCVCSVAKLDWFVLVTVCWLLWSGLSLPPLPAPLPSPLPSVLYWCFSILCREFSCDANYIDWRKGEGGGEDRRRREGEGAQERLTERKKGTEGEMGGREGVNRRSATRENEGEGREEMEGREDVEG